jgi:hypothetical protein
MTNWLSSSGADFVGRAKSAAAIRVDGKDPRRLRRPLGHRGLPELFGGSGNQGDHIDLWNGTQIARGDNEYFERSEEIWFWPLP